jgi:hypothetical protein
MNTAATTLLNSIAAELNTTDKSMCINVAMAMLIKQGMQASEAMDALFGEGAYKAFAGQVYEALRSKGT